MSEHEWLQRYFAQYQAALTPADVFTQLIELKDVLKASQAMGKKAILAGNGGSAAIASHCAVDLTKNAGIRCINFNEADLITCLANDYGYERWLQKAVELYADDGDLVILISSSGRSPNLVHAGRFAASRALQVITFTGFAADNPLKATGRLNFWVNSRAYNIVEMTHQAWLLATCDLIIGTAEYPANREEPHAVHP